MVNKRGLSPEEFFKLDPDTLEVLMIYDSFIEPSGTKVEMLKHAYNNYYATINNPNLTSDARKSIKVSDFDFLGVLDNLTHSEREEKRKNDSEKHQMESINSIGMAIKQQALGRKNNGK
ncbi:MAG: hypothetical protein K0S95_752 [Pantoea eucrina]|jgi:hypothetical protein|nr:hypothetical protein [Pantoea eucrina]